MNKLPRDRASSSHQVPTRGIEAVEFVCPQCGGKRWGETRGRGHCNGYECGFSWAREFDWVHFRRVVDGHRFMSDEAFKIVISRDAPTVTLVGNFKDLLEKV